MNNVIFLTLKKLEMQDDLFDTPKFAAMLFQHIFYFCIFLMSDLFQIWYSHSFQEYKYVFGWFQVLSYFFRSCYNHEPWLLPVKPFWYYELGCRVYRRQQFLVVALTWNTVQKWCNKKLYYRLICHRRFRFSSNFKIIYSLCSKFLYNNRGTY